MEKVGDHLGVVEAGLAKRRRVADHKQRSVTEPKGVAIAGQGLIKIAHSNRDVRKRDNTNHLGPLGYLMIVEVCRIAWRRTSKAANPSNLTAPRASVRPGSRPQSGDGRFRRGCPVREAPPRDLEPSGRCWPNRRTGHAAMLIHAAAAEDPLEEHRRTWRIQNVRPTKLCSAVPILRLGVPDAPCAKIACRTRRQPKVFHV